MKNTTKLTRFAMLVVMTLGLLLSACKPESIVTSRTDAENTVIAWVEATDPLGTSNNLP